MATFDPTRLYSTLLNTGLQVKDNALYQVIHDLIAALATVNKQTNSLAASSSSVTNITNVLQQLTESTDFGIEEFQVINNSSVTNINTVNNVIQQILESSSSDFSAIDDFQIPGPLGPAGPIVPYFIGVNEVFLVPIFKQALFAMNIEVQGILEVDGFLIEVENNPSSSSWTPTDVSGAGLTLTINNASYTKIGPLVLLAGFIVYPVTASGLNALIGGIPFNGGSSVGVAAALTSAGITIIVSINATDNKITIQNMATGAQITNAQLSNQSLLFTIPYSTM